MSSRFSRNIRKVSGQLDAMSKAVRGVAFEQLEDRRLMTITGDLTLGYPTLSFDTTGSQIKYVASAADGSNVNALDVVAHTTELALDSSHKGAIIQTQKSDFQIHIYVDQNGNVLHGVSTSDSVNIGTNENGYDFRAYGTTSIDDDGDPSTPRKVFTGLLLTGEIKDFGFHSNPADLTNASFYFTFVVTGGALAPAYAGHDIAVNLFSHGSTFNPDPAPPLGRSFSGTAEGFVGPRNDTGGGPPSPVVLSGIKYQDITGDGFSSDDTPLGGVTINLFKDLDNDGVLTDADGGSIASTLTAADGSYSFDNLPAGRYFVKEAPNSSYVQTGGLEYYTVNPTAGQAVTGLNFDNFKKISISGTKYNDLSGDGITADDQPLAGITIQLSQGGNVIATTTTDTQGHFSFADLGPGTYAVQEVTPTGWTETAGAAGHTVIALSGQDSTGNDFANFHNITISGTKTQDITGNGFSADDTPLAGVTINLYLNGSATPFTSTVTAADGSYSFPNLGPGTYSVQEVLPAGWLQTAGQAVYTITATSGQDASGNNFANFKKVTISGTKFTDITGDSFSADDTPLAGVTVNLYSTADLSTPVASTVTAADGTYSFADLGPGTYFVQEVLPSGYVQTGGNAGYTVAAASGQDSTGNNFDNFRTITVSGTKYTDITGNGITTDDTPLAGVTINLYNAANPATPIASTVTGANGTFAFANLGPGTYFVQEVLPAGYVQTAGNAGYTITATSGQDASGNNFANFKKITISGKKFTDVTGDSFSADDTPLAGITINLFSTSNLSTPVASTVTAADGSYSFANLGPGTYFVQEVLPTGYVQTGGNAGYTVAATSGQDSSGNNFDNFKLICISGTKYNDLTGNGITADDMPLAGITINLYKNGSTSPVASTVTGADGKFSFPSLGPGVYTVKEVVPANATQTVGSAGYTVTANSGANSARNDFANFSNITISGTKFKDLTGNSFTADDTPLAGITINLYKNGSTSPVASTVTAANGTYSFANLGPGSYFVQEVVPAGYTQTGGNAGYTIAARSGSNSAGNNFDNYLTPPPASISGTKFLDLTGNGFSADDTGLGGVTIQLYKDKNNDGLLTSADGSAVCTTVTAADGTYSFTGLASGTYFVKEVLPTGYVRTGPTLTDTYTVTLVAGQNATGKDFDNFLLDCDLSEFTGVYFVIRSGNSVKTVTDLRGNTSPGDQVTAYFYFNGDADHVATLVSYTAPDAYFDANHASQQAIFDIDSEQLQPGLNSLTVQLPLCNYQVDFVCGSAIDKLGPANSNIFYSAQQRLISADNDGPGYSCTSFSSLSGSVFDDCDANGLLDGLNQGIAGVVVTLTGTPTGSTTPITLSRTTAADGSYAFKGLPAGNYTITETQPAGYLDGVDKVGTINGSTKGTLGADKISNIALGSNQNGIKYNFGEFTPGTVSGLVYADVNNNGNVDLGDSGIAGVKITLTGTDVLGNAVSLTATTGADGSYLFSGLRPSNSSGYTITETANPAGYTDGKDTLGTVNGVAVGTASNDKFSGVRISCNDDAINYNFGEIPQAGTKLACGMTATIGFWQNKNGQALINALNGSCNSKALGNWLASNFPNLFSNLSGQTNTQVAAYFVTCFKQTGQKLQAQTLAAALAVYVTDSDLAGTVAKSYGFTVNSNGTGSATYNVGSNGSAAGLTNSTSYSIMALLQKANTAKIFSASSSAQTAWNNIFSDINQTGDIT